jgi:hypothetical protein
VHLKVILKLLPQAAAVQLRSCVCVIFSCWFSPVQTDDIPSSRPSVTLHNMLIS